MSRHLVLERDMMLPPPATVLPSLRPSLMLLRTLLYPPGGDALRGANELDVLSALDRKDGSGSLSVDGRGSMIAGTSSADLPMLLYPDERRLLLNVFWTLSNMSGPF